MNRATTAVAAATDGAATGAVANAAAAAGAPATRAVAIETAATGGAATGIATLGAVASSGAATGAVAASSGAKAEAPTARPARSAGTPIVSTAVPAGAAADDPVEDDGAESVAVVAADGSNAGVGPAGNAGRTARASATTLPSITRAAAETISGARAITKKDEALGHSSAAMTLDGDDPDSAEGATTILQAAVPTAAATSAGTTGEALPSFAASSGTASANDPAAAEGVGTAAAGAIAGAPGPADNAVAAGLSMAAAVAHGAPEAMLGFAMPAADADTAKHAHDDGTAAGGTPDAAAAVVQSLAPQPSDTAATIPTLRVHANVDGADFAQGLSERVSYMVDNDLNGAKLQVNPSQLGPIEVRITVLNGHAQVWMTTHSAVTRDALEASSAKLREMLGTQGFGQVSVDISQRSFQERSTLPQPYESSTGAAPRSAAAAATTIATGSAARSSAGALDAYA